MGRSLLTRRFYAFMLDLFTIAFLKNCLVFIYINFVSDNLISFFPHSYFNLVSNLYRLHFFILYIVALSYFFLSFYVGRGYTLGSLAVGIRAIGNEQKEDSFSLEDSFARAFGHVVCLVGGLFPYLLCFFRSDRRTIPDLLSGGRVVLQKEYEEDKERFQETSVITEENKSAA